MGEVNRSMAIAKEYGERLFKNSELCDEESLKTLISGYPSHSFVIDREEAKGIFKSGKVRECTPDEIELLENLEHYSRIPSTTGWVKMISDDILEEDKAHAAVQAETVLEQPGTAGTSTQTTGTVPTDGQAAAAGG